MSASMTLDTRPADQAHGLRRLFAQSRARVIPVASNPHLAFGGVALERLCTAFAELGLHTLVVDADERAPAPLEWSMLELSEGIEELTPQMSYLAARGLPVRFVDARGSTERFLQAVTEAAPRAGVVLVHAAAADLCRLFSGRQVRPLLLADDRPNAVTHAYASLKLLASRAGLMVHDLLLTAAPHSPRPERIATQLSKCADAYLGAVLHDWALIDPATCAADAASPALRRLARALLLACEPDATPAHVGAEWIPTPALWSRPAVDAARRNS
jgi:flagellar biosynthesis protein FlhG